ncbi:hypothetical protein [Sphingomicrobium arenosum]|uniref:hypothetical protein n=1 Tax=Sphingomicrobium arenosum TaxID=2233861 RepID=UPI002240BF68|nr:hypothetical protein [Sphingomicrobium arenosum]
MEGRTVRLRFDAADWMARGGPLPRRLAASVSSNLWSHYVAHAVPGWEAHFDSQNLPITAWRAQYDTADDLFVWLRTAPEARDGERRFGWFVDPSHRPNR